MIVELFLKRTGYPGQQLMIWEFLVPWFCWILMGWEVLVGALTSGILVWMPAQSLASFSVPFQGISLSPAWSVDYEEVRES